jgi:hypothetical protein
VIDVLSDLFILRGIPSHIRSDNGPEFVAQAVQEAYIERGSPWENGYMAVTSQALTSSTQSWERRGSRSCTSWCQKPAPSAFSRTRTVLADAQPWP